MNQKQPKMSWKGRKITILTILRGFHFCAWFHNLCLKRPNKSYAGSLCTMHPLQSRSCCRLFTWEPYGLQPLTFGAVGHLLHNCAMQTSFIWHASENKFLSFPHDLKLPSLRYVTLCPNNPKYELASVTLTSYLPSIKSIIFYLWSPLSSSLDQCHFRESRRSDGPWNELLALSSDLIPPHFLWLSKI